MREKFLTMLSVTYWLSINVGVIGRFRNTTLKCIIHPHDDGGIALDPRPVAMLQS
jgi:hypothetical protein